MHPDFELFDRFKRLASDLGMTASVVQNDHDRLIADGAITAEEIRNSIQTFIERCADHTSELESLQSATVKRLDAVLAALNENTTPEDDK